MTQRILIVDDALFMRMSMRKILSGAGLEIAGEAENGAVAVQKYKETRPDAVLMDITMPVMDGITAIKAILALDPSAKILMCTALGQQNLVIEALRIGAKDYIVKPFHPERVLKGIHNALANQEA